MSSASVASVSTATRAPTNVSSAVKAPKASTMGLIAWLAGLLTITVSMTVQLWTLDHGTSGQLAIESGLHKALWPGLTGAVLLAVGFMFWILFNENERYKYPALFILAFSSYVMANFAIYASSKQVTVANK
jgi:hypothetical protein